MILVYFALKEQKSADLEITKLVIDLPAINDEEN
jgi:hypothetical protein